MRKLGRLCVFCGSSSGFKPAYAEAARVVGELLARRGIQLVYGGGKVGLMGAVADACLARGGAVTGVMPRSLVEKEIAHGGLTDLRVVESMHERKAMMAELSDGFIAMPGGFGTWEEFCEIVTWAQLGIHRKPTALLNVEGYYDALLAMANRAVEDGFVRASHRDLVIADTNAERLLERMAAHDASYEEKWVGPVVSA